MGHISPSPWAMLLPPPPLREHQESQENDGHTGSWCLDNQCFHTTRGTKRMYGTANLPIPTRSTFIVPRGNIPQVTLPSPPPPPSTMQRDTEQVMQTQGHMNHKMSQELPLGMHVQLCSETGSVCHFFWREYLTLKSCTCSTGVTRMGSPAADLAATWAAGLAALLVEGLARRLAALGAGLARGLAGGTSPCGQHNLGKRNTAPKRLEIDNSTSWVRVKMINIRG